MNTHGEHEHDHGHEHGHTGHAPAPAADFSPQEVAELRKSDVQGAAAIVGLMAGIFSVGLVLYIIVLISCL